MEPWQTTPSLVITHIFLWSTVVRWQHTVFPSPKVESLVCIHVLGIDAKKKRCCGRCFPLVLPKEILLSSRNEVVFLLCRIWILVSSSSYVAVFLCLFWLSAAWCSHFAAHCGYIVVIFLMFNENSSFQVQKRVCRQENRVELDPRVYIFIYMLDLAVPLVYRTLLGHLFFVIFFLGQLCICRVLLC